MNSFHDRLSTLYLSYLNIKPLIAEIEVRYERFPTPILNEIRAFNDHIAHCHMHGVAEEIIEEEIKKAAGHIERLILDCYKFLNVKFHKTLIRAFDKRTKGVNLDAISNGDFFKAYSELKRSIVNELKNAKLTESLDKKKALALYEKVYNKYSRLEALIISNEKSICWARARFYGRTLFKFLGWLFAAVISGIISTAIIPWDKLWDFVSTSLHIGAV
jgi:hypothetical protein